LETPKTYLIPILAIAKAFVCRDASNINATHYSKNRLNDLFQFLKVYIFQVSPSILINKYKVTKINFYISKDI